jgi:hypothetical protein
MLRRGEYLLPLLGIEPQSLCHPDRCLVTISTELPRLLILMIIMSGNCYEGLGDDDILGIIAGSLTERGWNCIAH